MSLGQHQLSHSSARYCRPLEITGAIRWQRFVDVFKIPADDDDDDDDDDDV